MYRIFCLLLILIFFSCGKEKAGVQYLKPDTFIEKAGKYELGTKQIWLKEFTDGTMVFEIGNNFNRETLYRQSMFRPFSKHHQWVMYIDKAENIWCYNGDLQDHFVLFYNRGKEKYIEKDYVTQHIKLPKEFSQQLDQ